MSEIVVQGVTPGIRVSGSGSVVTVKVTTGSGGGGGVTDHNALTGRSDPDQHPIGAVTGLQAALNGKVATGDERLSDARTPTAHAASHATGGTDQVTPAAIGARPAGNVDWSEIDNKPSIPAAQVNSDWAASSGVAEILHKPTIPSAPADIGAAEETHAHAAADVTSGIIAPARLGTGTADATTVLHGDGTWGPAGGGKVWARAIPPSASIYHATGRFNSTGTVYSAGSMYLTPFVLLNYSYSYMAVRVATAGGSGEILRLGIYERNDDGTCGDLLVDAGTVATDSPGLKEAAISFTPTDPNVYLAFVGQGPTKTATFFMQNNNAYVLSNGSADGTFENQGLYMMSGVTGALPASPTPSTSDGFKTVVIGLR